MNVEQFQEKLKLYGQLLVKTHLLHALALFASVLIAGQFLLVAPLQFLAKKEQQDLVDFRKKYDLRKALLSSSENFDDFLNEQKKNLDRLNQATFAPGQQVKVITAVAEMVDELGVEVSKINPVVRPAGPEDLHHPNPVHLYPVEMELIGHYAELGAFLEMLKSGFLQFQVETFEIGPKIQDSLLKASLKISAFEERGKA